MPIMNFETIAIIVACLMVASFVSGWLVRWIFDKLNTSEPIASADATSRMKAAEEALQVREREFSATEAQYANAYAQLEAELEAAMEGLGAARRELEIRNS